MDETQLFRLLTAKQLEWRILMVPAGTNSSSRLSKYSQTRGCKPETTPIVPAGKPLLTTGLMPSPAHAELSCYAALAYRSTGASDSKTAEGSRRRSCDLHLSWAKWANVLYIWPPWSS